MKAIEVTSMPTLRFAHIYGTTDYRNRFYPQKNFIEISYIEKGSITICDGENQYVAEENDITCLVRDRQIDITSKGYHRHHTVGINLEWVDKYNGGILLPVVTQKKNKTSDICRKIDWLIHNSIICEHSPTKCAAEILDLLCKIDECNRKTLSDELPGDYIYVYKAKKYLSKHITEPIMQKDIAKHLGITPTYLCSIFKKNEGITLMKYINSEKLKSIKTLMETKKLPLYEAAALYGYSDPNYVSRLYKNIFGYNITDVPNKR